MNPHSCYNRERKGSYVAFDGYRDASRTVPMTYWIPDTMSHDCQYSKHTTNDPRCEGCKHKASA